MSIQDRAKKRRSHEDKALVVLSILLVCVQLANCSLDPLSAINLLPISPKGIVVQKRPAIIASLDQSFRGRHGASCSETNTTAPTNGPLPSIFNGFSGSRIQQQPTKRQNSSVSQQSILYLDRKQQEHLAANPNYSLLAGQLMTRFDSSQATNRVGNGANGGAGYRDQQSSMVPKLLSSAQQQQASPPVSGSNAATTSTVIGGDSATSVRNEQQLYRGYSLIELEVRSEQDRRYVQELYGNLSAALNDQATKPQTLTVSPYADIDFWSFKNGVNDQVDIMLSPRSRQFILNQLNGAKIKHRVKIDDIQARLEQQTNQQMNGSISSSFGTPSGDYNLQLSGRQSPNDGQASNNDQAQKEKTLNGRQDFSSIGSNVYMNDSLFFENFQRLADINQYLESLVGKARDVASVQVIGRSSQGRYLRVLRLGYEQRDADGSTSDAANAINEDPTGNQASNVVNASRIVQQFMRRHQSVKKLGSIWLDGGTHAREWISPATVLYMAFRLVDNHARCQRFFDHLRQGIQQENYVSNEVMSGRRSHERPPSQLDSELLLELTDINRSLMSLLPSSSPSSSSSSSSAGSGGGSSLPLAKQRGRTEAEQKWELLNKRPQELASEHGCDLELEQLLRRYTFYIEPVLNPDGYEYSHTHNRLWRKTRSTSNHPIYRHFCLGADPNRNYDARHGSTGSSSHPCSQTYGGSTPFTEPETRHQSNFVYSHRSNMKMYISFHSYSQMILLPFSHSKQLAPDHKDLESVGQAAVKAIERTHGTQYRVGPSASILYTASGTASDWAYEKAGIKYSYTIELRDTGSFGFLLPKQQIIPTGEETFNGLLAMISQMEKNDNLLSSKSSHQTGGMQLDGMPFEMNNSIPLDHSASIGANGEALIHAPDLDQLRPFGRFRLRPAQLENAIDGSQTWATPQPRPPGVRDRRPAPNSIDESLQASRANSYDRFLPHNSLQDETISTSDNEPDAGLAFEGEGELMEPTDNLASKLYVNTEHSGQTIAGTGASVAMAWESVAAVREAKEQATLKARSVMALSDRLRARNENDPQSMTLSANGRSLINNPAPNDKETRLPLKRESSHPKRAHNKSL